MYMIFAVCFLLTALAFSIVLSDVVKSNETVRLITPDEAERMDNFKLFSCLRADSLYVFSENGELIDFNFYL